jgi:hypothetical protein
MTMTIDRDEIRLTAERVVELLRGNKIIGVEADLAEREIRKLADKMGERVTELPLKYGRDHGAIITMGDLVEKLLVETDKEKFLDILDEEFLFGAWGHWLKTADHYLLKDLRGLVLNLARDAQRVRTMLDEIQAKKKKRKREKK